MSDERDYVIERLTQGQIDCLLLVAQHLPSKEIGPRLGISPHTVDQRIRNALRVLGCTNRFQAAQIVASRTVPATIFQWQRTGAEPFVEYPVRTPSRGQTPLPFAIKKQPNNQMSTTARLLWIVGIGFGSAFSAGVYLAGLESLARLLQGV